MTRKEKDQMIDKLLEKLTANTHYYLTDISGLKVSESNNFRRSCFNQGVELMVVKNTLLKKAMEKAAGNYEETYEVLKGNTAVMFSSVANLPAKLIRDFRKVSAKPILKAAFVEESLFIGDENLSALASLKSKNELIAEIIALLQSPAKNVISALKSGGSKLSGILKTLSVNKQKENNN